MQTIPAIQLEPQYRDYVWGGTRLRPGGERTAEAWILYENDRIASGPQQGATLSQVTRKYGPALLGSRAMEHTGSRFPLLIKLLDCAKWLSVQVHPNDEQARELEGDGHFGKTEAWHILQAEEGASLIAGLKKGVTKADLQQAIPTRRLLDLSTYLEVQTGDSIYIPPGTLHALGPGLLIYEVQQTSDITYRVYDWDRPATAGRALHVEQSLEVIDPSLSKSYVPAPDLSPGDPRSLVQSPYFKLEKLLASGEAVYLDTRGQAFHSLTVIDGRARLTDGKWSYELGRFEHLLVPACTGEYQVLPDPACSLLIAQPV